jgi:DNA invertase Pin-like site-specific DNA recombinase
VFGYASVRESHALTELTEQSAVILDVCEQHDWSIVEIARDLVQAERPGLDRSELGRVLRRLESCEDSCLVVAQLGRLSGSAADLADVLSRLTERGIRLVAVDVQMDTATAPGRLAADALISVGAWERQRIEGSAEAFATSPGKSSPSSRPAVHDVPALKQHIVDMRASGMTLQAIADRLNAEGVPTLRGGQRWRPSSVQAAVGYHRPPQRRGAPYGGVPYGGAQGGRS